jgi:hypothetical protein
LRRCWTRARGTAELSSCTRLTTCNGTARTSYITPPPPLNLLPLLSPAPTRPPLATPPPAPPGPAPAAS